MAEENKTLMEIRVYGKETCGICAELKTNIKNSIKENGLVEKIKLIELDIEKDPNALAEYAMIGTNKVPYALFKDLATGSVNRCAGLALPAVYFSNIFKTKGYIL